MTSVSPVVEDGLPAQPSTETTNDAKATNVPEVTNVADFPNTTLTAPVVNSSPPASTGDYKNVGFTAANIAPPKTDLPEKAVYKEPEFQRAPAMTEGAARAALLRHVTTQFCWGKGAANELQITKIDSSTSYNYTLETFTESRATKLETEPYQGQPIDGPQNGMPPGPWDLFMQPCEDFREIEVRTVEVPHTASIQQCHGCQGSGTLSCNGCGGKGNLHCELCRGEGRRRQRIKMASGNMAMNMADCDGCNGKGRKPCIRCSGSGQMSCSTCYGTATVKMFIQLTVTWKTYKDKHIAGKANVPKDLISKVKGSVAFQDAHPMLMPLTRAPDPEITSASARFIASHNFPHMRILNQRHTVTTIPITHCLCNLKNGKNMSYYVYGLDSRVYAPEYPETFCWGCEIM